jgi:hypothetical protein
MYENIIKEHSRADMGGGGVALIDFRGGKQPTSSLHKSRRRQKKRG